MIRKRSETPLRPEIVCLCGSTKFQREFELLTMNLALEGKIVLTVGCFGHTDYPPGAREKVFDPEVKRRLDELHKRKIDVADYVLVVDVDGYVGESTRSEIAYAEDKGIPVRYAYHEHTQQSSESQQSFESKILEIMSRFSSSDVKLDDPVSSHFDSLDIVEVSMAAEDKFKIDITDEEIVKLGPDARISDIVNLVFRKIETTQREAPA